MKLLADCYRETNFKSECKQVPEPEANSIYCLAEIYQTLALADNVDKREKKKRLKVCFETPRNCIEVLCDWRKSSAQG